MKQSWNEFGCMTDLGWGLMCCWCLLRWKRIQTVFWLCRSTFFWFDSVRWTNSHDTLITIFGREKLHVTSFSDMYSGPKKNLDAFGHFSHTWSDAMTFIHVWQNIKKSGIYKQMIAFIRTNFTFLSTLNDFQATGCHFYWM